MESVRVKTWKIGVDKDESGNKLTEIKNRLETLLQRLSRAGGVPSDTEEVRLRKAVLILFAGICLIMGIFWGIAYLALGRPLAGIFPLGYSTVSLVSLLYFFRSKGYKLFCRGQLALILILPFLLQWSLGGYWSSGAVIIWSILSPIGALMFAGTTRATPWFFAYVLLMVLSGFINVRSASQTDLPTFITVMSFVMNIGGVSAIVFFLLKYFVHERERAMAELDKEHRRVRQSLSLAMEVQQNLLPKSDPEVAGLDICGKSIYCDETGGDYYDFLETGKPGDGKIGLAVGDVSDHGIPSALLMTTTRALIRQRCSQFGNPERLVSDVNRQLTDDVRDSGRFMTLFYAEFDCKKKLVHWLNAGHEPAIIYSPHTDSFDELSGRGNLPLGVARDAEYTVNRQNIAPGQIILIATDGIWEARNSDGEMYGKEKVYEIIRKNAQAGANDIQRAILASLKAFRKDARLEDDMTMVVVKIKDDPF
jgi:serine phosphatase RsbU (regulator of sigma subunit)